MQGGGGRITMHVAGGDRKRVDEPQGALSLTMGLMSTPCSNRQSIRVLRASNLKAWKVGGAVGIVNVMRGACWSLKGSCVSP